MLTVFIFTGAKDLVTKLWDTALLYHESELQDMREDSTKAKLHAAFDTFLSFGSGLLGRRSVKINFVPSPEPVESNSNPTTLSQAFQAQGLSLSERTCMQYLGNDLRVPKAKKMFHKLKMQRGLIHSEIQLLYHLVKQKKLRIFHTSVAVREAVSFALSLSRLSKKSLLEEVESILARNACFQKQVARAVAKLQSYLLP